MSENLINPNFILQYLIYIQPSKHKKVIRYYSCLLQPPCKYKKFVHEDTNYFQQKLFLFVKSFSFPTIVVSRSISGGL